MPKRPKLRWIRSGTRGAKEEWLLYIDSVKDELYWEICRCDNTEAELIASQRIPPLPKTKGEMMTTKQYKDLILDNLERILRWKK